MGCPVQPTTPSSDHYERWLFRYGVSGDMRFISHHDTMRMFRRALARAALPVRFSAGFNPHARLSILLPRPVGVASRAEALVVEFRGRLDGDAAREQLAAQLPSGITIESARRLEPGERPQPALVRYRLEPGDVSRVDLEKRTNEILASKTLEVSRVIHKNGTTRIVDLRPSLADMRVDDLGVEFTLCTRASGTAKPSEVAALLGEDAQTVNHRIVRLDIEWEQHHYETNTIHDRREDTEHTQTQEAHQTQENGHDRG